MPPEFARDVEFHKLIAGREDIDLVRLMLEFATDAYPRLDDATCLVEIERLGRRAAARLLSLEANDEADLPTQLQAVSDLLYAEEGFHGNEEQYYDPRNSYLNEVLRRRCGLPIALGILYMTVATRAGLNVYGVGTPTHFVLGADAGDESWYVDPFAAGEIMTRDACRKRIEERAGWEPTLDDEAFRPATMLEIAARVLRNLKTAYCMADLWTDVLPVQQRLTMLLPELSNERRDLGLVYLRTGQAKPALELLERHVETCGPQEAETLAPYLRSARRMAAEMN